MHKLDFVQTVQNLPQHLSTRKNEIRLGYLQRTLSVSLPQQNIYMQQGETTKGRKIFSTVFQIKPYLEPSLCFYVKQNNL